MDIRGRLIGAIGLTSSLIWEPHLIRDVPYWIHRGRLGADVLGERRPWWNQSAVQFVEARLKPGSIVLEYGAGASTLWFVDRGCKVMSVENDKFWFDALQAAPGISDAELLFIAPENVDWYVDAVNGQPFASLDLVVVDGRHRVRCSLASIQRVKPGGMLLLDDSQRSRYDEIRTQLESWPRASFRGLKPRSWLVSETTVWTRPPEAVA